MAGQDGSAPPAVNRSRHEARAAFEAELARSAAERDFFTTLRRIEALYPERPRLGEAARPTDEPLRLGQEPSLAFAPGAVAAYQTAADSRPARLRVNFLGLLGANGPLPLHLTEYARDRLRNSGDQTLARFLDLFNHRMLSLFYRAWANSEPTVSADRPENDRFARYVDSLVGVATRAQPRSGLPADVRRFYAGRFATAARNAEGLRAIIGEHLRLPTEIEELIGDWVELPDSARWRLGSGPGASALGRSTTIGARAFSRQGKFRVVLGPLRRDQFQSLLPGGPVLERLRALVKVYVGDDASWDLRLFLDERTDEPLRLGKGARMGWNSWLGRGPQGMRRQDVVLNPEASERAPAAPATMSP